MRFPDPISHLRSHLLTPELEQMRNIALSAAGFSAALIIFLAQSNGQSAYSAIALWASIASMVIWLFGFQYVSAYLIHGERTYRHINIVLAGFIAIFGYSFLFIAVVATVWRLSRCAGIVLIVLGLALAIASFVHSRAVERICNETDA